MHWLLSPCSCTYLYSTCRLLPSFFFLSLFQTFVPESVPLCRDCQYRWVPDSGAVGPPCLRYQAWHLWCWERCAPLYNQVSTFIRLFVRLPQSVLPHYLPCSAWWAHPFVRCKWWKMASGWSKFRSLFFHFIAMKKCVKSLFSPFFSSNLYWAMIDI